MEKYSISSNRSCQIFLKIASWDIPQNNFNGQEQMKKRFGIFFVSKELLFSTDPDLINRFYYARTISKFYLNIDVDSPGKIGQWLGLQIVNSYQKRA
ncbi:MAG: hypothetical protein CM15mP59_1900 [Flavobacteriaceae bacterium]|nr:MAG: hypothetical protein CM15mP59_1900 [Flavobacteriaceae bacterium]